MTSRLSLAYHAQARRNCLKTAVEFAEDLIRNAPEGWSTAEKTLSGTNEVIFTADWPRERTMRVMDEVESILYSSGWISSFTLRRRGNKWKVVFEFTRMTQELYNTLQEDLEEPEAEDKGEDAKKWERMFQMAMSDMEVVRKRACEIMREKHALQEELKGKNRLLDEAKKLLDQAAEFKKERDDLKMKLAHTRAALNDAQVKILLNRRRSDSDSE